MKYLNFAKEPVPTREIRGFSLFEGLLPAVAQDRILSDIRAVLQVAPLRRMTTRRGSPLSVRMSGAGQYGWTSDTRGYRYEPRMPDGAPWPEIPESLHEIWEAVSACTRAPESCLINWYDGKARMGLHRDSDEADLACPVVSISLGDDALFRIGNLTKGGRTESVWLRSGDVMVMGGDARLCYHGVDRIAAGTSPLMPRNGRVNLTLRVVT